MTDAVQVHVRLDSEMLARVDQMAQQQSLSRSALLRQTIKQTVGNEEKLRWLAWQGKPRGSEDEGRL